MKNIKKIMLSVCMLIALNSHAELKLNPQAEKIYQQYATMSIEAFKKIAGNPASHKTAMKNVYDACEKRLKKTFPYIKMDTLSLYAFGEINGWGSRIYYDGGDPSRSINASFDNYKSERGSGGIVRFIGSEPKEYFEDSWMLHPYSDSELLPAQYEFQRFLYELRLNLFVTQSNQEIKQLFAQAARDNFKRLVKLVNDSTLFVKAVKQRDSLLHSNFIILKYNALKDSLSKANQAIHNLWREEAPYKYRKRDKLEDELKSLEPEVNLYNLKLRTFCTPIDEQIKGLQFNHYYFDDNDRIIPVTVVEQYKKLKILKNNDDSRITDDNYVEMCFDCTIYNYIEQCLLSLKEYKKSKPE